ncbi:hypothetical protein Tco_0050763, partial [Tanacetum coccineum]
STIDLSNSGLEEFQQPECLKAMDLRPVRVSIKIPLMRLTAITIKGKGCSINCKEALSIKNNINKNFNQKINTAKEKVYTAKPKAVNTAKPKAVNTSRPTSVVVNAIRENQVNAVKASACWVWRPTKLNNESITFKRQNYIDA